jgi:hypothetical protein
MTARPLYAFDIIARVLAERLRSCGPSEELRVIVGSRGVDWERVVGCASADLVLPAFAAALTDLGLRRTLDPELAAFLDAVHVANAERNAELRAELTAAVGVLNRAGIEPVLLKGAIRLLDGLYPDDGWRMLRDLDLLVPQASLVAATQALTGAGYASCGSGGEVRRRGGACQIDLHTEPFCSPRQVRLLSAADVLESARRTAFGDGEVGIPSVEHQVVHLIGHCQIRHLGHAFGRIGLRHRLEAAALVQWGPKPIDWTAVSQRFVAAGYRRPLLAFLLALNDGGWCAVPLTDRIDWLVALQRRRIALQARSTTLAYVGSRLGGFVSAFGSQLEHEGGQFRALNNLRRMVSERGAARRMVQAFRERQRHLMHALPYLGWLAAAP